MNMSRCPRINPNADSSKTLYHTAASSTRTMQSCSSDVSPFAISVASRLFTTYAANRPLFSRNVSSELAFPRYRATCDGHDSFNLRRASVVTKQCVSRDFENAASGCLL